MVKFKIIVEKKILNLYNVGMIKSATNQYFFEEHS